MSGGKGAVLGIRIVSDAKGVAPGFAEAESAVAGFQRGLDRASIAAGAAIAGIAGVAMEAYDAASALQQSTGAVESVFADEWAGEIQRAAEGAAQSVGLATSAYQDSAALIGAQLKGLGFPIADNVARTQELIAAGSDLAATFGGTTEEAVAALSSALKGERDPIERYGITLSQAAVDAKTAALGLDTSTDAAKRNADAQAALAIIAEQSAGAQGAFAREADTAAGQAQRAGAEFENAKAALGEVLLPVVADGMQRFAELSGVLSDHSGTVQVVTAVVAGLAAAVLTINAAMRVYAAGQALVTAATWAWNTALLANPITWVVVAVSALIAAVVLAYQKFEWFRNIVRDVWEWLKKAWDWAGKVADKAADFLGFGASATLTVTPEAGGTVAGMFGSAGGPAGGPAGSYAPVYGASMSALAGGGSTTGQGLGGNTINVVINDAYDPVSVGRTLERILRQYAEATGSQVALTVGGRR